MGSALATTDSTSACRHSKSPSGRPEHQRASRRQIAVGYQPGSRWQYSGGGYLILQLLVEEVTRQPFGAFMRRAVLDPLELSCSSFESTPSPNVGEAYDAAGRAASRFQYAAEAATGFSTCVRDMVRWVQAHVRRGETSPLDSDLLSRMRAPHGSQFGADIWGLGTMLYAPTAGDAFVYGHDGQNEPAINAAVRINPDNGDAIVVLTSGGRILATRLASEWTYWQTGGPDFLVIGTAIREAVGTAVRGLAGGDPRGDGLRSSSTKAGDESEPVRDAAELTIHGSPTLSGPLGPECAAAQIRRTVCANECGTRRALRGSRCPTEGQGITRRLGLADCDQPVVGGSCRCLGEESRYRMNRSPAIVISPSGRKPSFRTPVMRVRLGGRRAMTDLNPSSPKAWAMILSYSTLPAPQCFG